MTDEDMTHAAQVLLDMPLFHKLWDEMERQATLACVFAPSTDHDARQAHAADADSNYSVAHATVFTLPGGRKGVHGDFP